MEVINLNLIPNGTNPVVHVSQYDEGRDFRFNLFDGTSVLTLDGTETIECDVKKPDGNIVTVAVPNTSDSYIVVTTTLQMTACGGNSLGTINISKGGINLYTLNFVLYCERSPLENGIESESSIHNLNTMVDEMVAEEVATQYDSANVIFDNAPTENHGIGYTVTSEGIKTAIDNAFDYDNTASGSIVHIEDGADNIPVKSLVSEIVAVESGSGEKSPDNPYTISGFDNGIITVCGKNLFSNSDVRRGIYTNLDGSTTNANVSTNFSSAFIKCKPSTTYTIEMFDDSYLQGSLNVIYYDADKQGLNDGTTLTNLSSNTPKTFTTHTSAGYFVITGYRSSANGGTDIFTTAKVLITDSSDITYEAYNGTTYTFAFGQTVYGGHFDNKGNLVVTHGFIDLGTLYYSYYQYDGTGNGGGYTTGIANLIKKPLSSSIIVSALCSALNVESDEEFNNNTDDFKLSVNINGWIKVSYHSATNNTDLATKLSGIMLVYELATPITLSITSQDIPTLLGENNIFSNCGDVEVNYYTYKSNDILEFIDSEIGKKNGTNIPIEENSQDSIKDYIDDEVSTINTSLSEKADTNSVYAKTESFYCPQSHDFESGTTSSDAIIWFINTYGTKPMSFGFVITGLGWFECFLTFYSDSQGGGILLLNGSSRLWAVTYINGVITLTEK